MRGVRCALCANLERKGGYTDAWFNAELVEWLSETNVKYKTWSDIQMEEPYTGFVQICYYIGIDDPEHVMLFKLAWM